MRMGYGILGVRRRNQPVYPREEKRLGIEERKAEEIPKARKHFGHRGEKSGRNTQSEKKFWA